MHKHKYHFFSNISNEDKRIEAKVKYFFDCLSIAFNFTNKHYDFPCENHRTIITSIYYQIKYNKPSFATNHIKFYFNFFTENINQFQFLGYNTQCLTDLKNYIENLQLGEKPNFLRFEIPIETLLAELNETYFTKCFEKIRNHIVSIEELESDENNHSLIECIFQHTKLIAVEFYLTGASADDIKNIPINICNNDIKNNEQTKHLNGVKPNIEEYYKNRKLLEQLNEIKLIYKLFQSNQTVTFFIKPHYKINNKVDFNIFGVHITSEMPAYITDFNQSFTKYEKDNLIIDENTLFANININSNHSNTVNLAREKVLLALNSFSKFSENQYILDFAYYLSKNKSVIPLKTRIEYNDEIHKNAIYHYFRINKNILDSTIDKFLLKNDIIFITGRDAIKRIEILINLWFYIESYFGETEDAISKTSRILAERMKQEFENSLYDFLYFKYFTYLNGKPNFVKNTDVKEFETNLYSEFETKFKFFKKRFKHPIITKKLIKIENGKSTESTKYQEFINEYLKQVNIYRNMYVHSLIENNYFTGSNLNLLLKICDYFRQDLTSKALEDVDEKS